MRAAVRLAGLAGSARLDVRALRDEGAGSLADAFFFAAGLAGARLLARLAVVGVADAVAAAAPRRLDGAPVARAPARDDGRAASRAEAGAPSPTGRVASSSA